MQVLPVRHRDDINPKRFDLNLPLRVLDVPAKLVRRVVGDLLIVDVVVVVVSESDGRAGEGESGRTGDRLGFDETVPGSTEGREVGGAETWDGEELRRRLERDVEKGFVVCN